MPRRNALTTLLLSVLCVGGCASGQVSPTPRAACSPHVRDDVLPAWARGGFSDPKPRIPHALGTSGEIAAILFADPLLSPPPRDHKNKILWVSRVTAARPSDLSITAQRMSGSHGVGSPVARRVIGGPGPSSIDLPTPGCWRLTLRWAGRIDTLDLVYAARPR